MMRKLKIPEHVKARIEFALYDFGIKPLKETDTKIVYKLGYKGGVVLLVKVSYAENRMFLIFKGSSQVRITVAVHRRYLRVPKHYLTRYMQPPQHEHDMQFVMHFMAYFTSMTRAVADTLLAGECTSFPDEKTS